MVNIITAISKFVILFFIAMYTFSSFNVLREKPERKKKRIFVREKIYIMMIHFTGSLILYLNIHTTEMILFYCGQLAFYILIFIFYPILYPGANKALLNNMCFFLVIGNIIVTRLSYDRAVKQFIIVCMASVITLIVPYLVKRMKNLYMYKWIYCGAGIILLASVLVLGVVSRGAKLSLEFGSITIQPSEFVKIIFVFFVASFLWNETDFKSCVIATCFAAAFVLILVMSTDLGSALIFFVVYVFMLFVATKKIWYLGAGFAAGSAASVLAYRMFSHIKIRVATWINPWSDPDVKGYQIIQSMFAIGAGGWFGTGLFRGSPNDVPVVTKDFIFAAISEELGGFVSILIILECLCTFMIFVQIGMMQKTNFYKLLAIGFGISYAFQIFLTIGGAMKMIPLTGVTLPLVSYGGSSVLSTIFVFSIMQGLNILGNGEERDDRKYEKATAQNQRIEN